VEDHIMFVYIIFLKQHKRQNEMKTHTICWNLEY